MSIERNLRDQVSGVVLAGGRGARVGGVDKGLIRYHGKWLVEHVLDVLRPQVTALIISANRNHDRYRSLGAGVIGDHEPGLPGPLAGMAACLHTAVTDWCVILPCDTTGVPADAVRRLVLGAWSAGAPAAYALGGDGPQYTICALHTRLAADIDAALSKKQRAVRDLLFGQRAAAVDFSDCVLRNLNTPDAFSC